MPSAQRPAAGWVRGALRVLLAGVAGIALASGLVWRSIAGPDALADGLLGAGLAALVLAAALFAWTGLRTAHGRAVASAVLAVGLAVAAFALLSYINYAAVRGEVDLTRARRFTLAPATRAVLADLTAPVEVTVLLTPEDLPEDRLRLDEELIDLVSRFEELAGGRLTRRIWGAVEEERRILDYLRELGLEGAAIYPPVVIVRSGRARKVLEEPAFLERGAGGELLFRGEEALTSALVEVTEPFRRVVHFTQGHGEGEIDLFTPRGFPQVRAALEQQNLETRTVHLEREEAVPEDCALLVVLGPRRDFTPVELAAIDAYLGRGGRVLVLLDSRAEIDAELARLEGLLERWAVAMLPGMVFDRALSYRGDPSWVWVSSYGGHEIVHSLEGSPCVFLLPRGMHLAEDRRAPDGRTLRVAPLLASSADSWCEADPEPPAPGAAFGPGPGDEKGPIPLGAAVWQEGMRGDGLPQARLVVLGDASFLRTQNLERFDFSAPTHLDLLKNAANWLLERDRLISVTPRRYHGVRRLTHLDISDREIRAIMWGGMMGLPTLVLIAGLLVWLWRRR
ncbi:MAG: GldG family protein [Planctomycetes bacterium]|nr:GldG family protein [Planctomycetota bacterium]